MTTSELIKRIRDIIAEPYSDDDPDGCEADSIEKANWMDEKLIDISTALAEYEGEEDDYD